MKMYLGEFGKIVEVEVERCTKDFVVFKNKRKDAKCSSWRIYGETREEVKAKMVRNALSEIRKAESNMLYNKERLRKIELL